MAVDDIGVNEKAWPETDLPYLLDEVSGRLEQYISDYYDHEKRNTHAEVVDLMKVPGTDGNRLMDGLRDRFQGGSRSYVFSAGIIPELEGVFWAGRSTDGTVFYVREHRDIIKDELGVMITERVTGAWATAWPPELMPENVEPLPAPSVPKRVGLIRRAGTTAMNWLHRS